jgi:ribonuclease HII
LNVEIITIVDGDALIPEISAASIVAKVTRDKLMSKLHLSYPDYAFDKHK